MSTEKKHAVNIHGYLCFLHDIGNRDEIAAMKTLQLAHPEGIAALVPAMLDSRPQRRIVPCAFVEEADYILRCRWEVNAVSGQ